MTIKSSLRFLYILGGSGLLCAAAYCSAIITPLFSDDMVPLSTAVISVDM